MNNVPINLFYYSLIFFSYFFGSLILTKSDFSYFNDFFMNDKMIDFTLAAFFSLIISFYFQKIIKNPIILIFWSCKIFFIFFFSIFVDINYSIDKDGFFVNGINNPLLNIDNIGNYESLVSNLDGTMVMHLLNYLFSLFLPNSIFFFKLFYGLLFFIAILLLSQTIKSSKFYQNIFLTLCFFIFTLNIFSSDINKDVLILFLCSSFFYLLSKNQINLILISIIILLAFFIRKWIGLSLSIVLVYNLIFIFKYNKIVLFLIFTIASFFFYTFFVESLISNNDSFIRLITQLQRSFLAGGSSFEPYRLNSYTKFFFLPIYSISTLFMPISFSSNIFLSLSSLENIILIVFITYVMYLFFKNLKNCLSILQSSNKSIFIFIIVWTSIYTPVIGNYGALVRYKTTVTPFFLLLIVLCIKHIHDSKKR